MKLAFNERRRWIGHEEELTALGFIHIPQKLIISTSGDKYIKIWGLDSELKCAININHPLPIMWNIKVEKSQKARKKVLYSLKILELIARRKKKSFKLGENKSFNINHFLADLSKMPGGQNIYEDFKAGVTRKDTPQHE